MKKLECMWINQPSKLDQYHHLHGTNVWAEYEYEGTHRIYFLNGDTVSQQILSVALSPGWIVRTYKETKEPSQTRKWTRIRSLKKRQLKLYSDVVRDFIDLVFYILLLCHILGIITFPQYPIW